MDAAVPESATADAPFYPDGQDHPGLTVPMMHLTAPQAYLRGDGYQAVLLPTGHRPGDGRRAARRAAVGAATEGGAAGLGGLLAGPATHQVALSMPRFRLEAEFDLIPALQQLGVSQAFSDDADFSGITRAEPLRISAVVHKAYIDVDEQGTEAAAATAVVMWAWPPSGPPPVTMVVDRPFLFAIDAGIFFDLTGAAASGSSQSAASGARLSRHRPARHCWFYLGIVGAAAAKAAPSACCFRQKLAATHSSLW